MCCCTTAAGFKSSSRNATRRPVTTVGEQRRQAVIIYARSTSALIMASTTTIVGRLETVTALNQRLRVNSRCRHFHSAIFCAVHREIHCPLRSRQAMHCAMHCSVFARWQRSTQFPANGYLRNKCITSQRQYQRQHTTQHVATEQRETKAVKLLLLLLVCKPRKRQPSAWVKD
jgi:hypothetical protein